MLTIAPVDREAPHQCRGILDQEERRGQVDRHDPGVEFRRGVEDGAAIGVAGGIDQDIEPPERMLGRRHDGAHGIEVGEIGSMEDSGAALLRERCGDRLAAFAIPAGHDDPGKPSRDEFMCYGLAEALRAASDDGDLAVEITPIGLSLRQAVPLPRRNGTFILFFLTNGTNIPFSAPPSQGG
jgi:hypothetical protein